MGNDIEGEDTLIHITLTHSHYTFTILTHSLPCAINHLHLIHSLCLLYSTQRGGNSTTYSHISIDVLVLLFGGAGFPATILFDFIHSIVYLHSGAGVSIWKLLAPLHTASVLVCFRIHSLLGVYYVSCTYYHY